MGLRLSQSLTMVLSLYFMLMAFNLSEAKTLQKRMFSTGNPFTFGGLRNAILHRQLQQQEQQPSESITWPKFMALKEHIRPSRQYQPIVGSSAFIPLGNNLPLEAEHRAVDHHESAPHLNEVDVQSSTDSTPEPPTEAPFVFRQFTPSLPQPIPIPFLQYSVPVPLPTSVSSTSFTPFNGQVSQTLSVPQPTSVQTSLPVSFTSIYNPEPVQPSSQSFTPYNAPAQQPTSQSFTPYNEQSSQQLPAAQPTPVPASPYSNVEPQSAPASFTPFNIPAPQSQFPSQSFTPYNQASQPLPPAQPTPVPATFNPFSNPDPQSARASFTPYNAPAQQPASQYTPHNAQPQLVSQPFTPYSAPVQQKHQPAPQSFTPHHVPANQQPATQYTPHNAPVQQHHPDAQPFIPYNPPVQQHETQYTPQNAPVQQHQPSPQAFTPYNAPVQQSETQYSPQNAPAQQHQPSPQTFTPQNAPVQQHQPSPQPFTPYSAPVQQPETQYTSQNAPVQQHQPSPQQFTPHNAPAPQSRATSYSSPISQSFPQYQESFSPFNAPQPTAFDPYNVPQPQPGPAIQQSFQPVDQAAPAVESSRSYDAPDTQAYGPPQLTQPFSIFQEMIHQNLVGWPGVDQASQQQGRQEPYQPQQHAHGAHQQDHRNSYATSRFLNFESPSTQFAKRSLESPPSPSELGFPSIGSFFDNFNNDVDWANFAGKRKRRSAQRTRSTHDWGNRKVIEDYDNIAVEARQSSESRVPAPSSRAVSNDRGHKQEPKQEYDGPYVYTQLFGPPYEVGYIRSPIPSKHVYEDYLQFVRSWSAASRDAVDDQLRSNPAAVKDYTSVKYTDSAPAYKEPSQNDAYKESAPAYKEPAYKESAPAYTESSAAYKDPVPAYKDTTSAYKDSAPAYKDEYRAPPFKGPSQSYKEPAYTEPEYKEPAYKEPAYKESTPAYKESAPAYTESAPAYKEPASTYKDTTSAYKDSTPAYKEVEYKAPVFKGPSPSYKEPAYTEQAYSKEPEYKEPSSSKGSVSAYREPEYKQPAQAYTEAAPAYKEPAYKEESYKEPPRTDRPVFREEIPYRGETSHKSAYKEESPKINYHSPQSDYVAPESEFRPTNRPYDAVGPKSPVYVERDFIPIKSQSYDAPTTTYRTTTGYDAPAKNGYPAAPVAYPPTAVYEPVTAKYKAPEASYESPTQSYEQATTKYKAPEASYEQAAYEAPKRYVETPTRDYLPTKKYENPPARTPSPSAAYYKPPNRYVEPPQHGTKYDAPAAYESPAPAKYVEPAYEAPKKYETAYESPAPAKYVEPAYEAPKKYEAAYESPAPAKYVEPAYEAPGKYVEYPPTTHKPDEYRVIPLTTPAYKETYPVDDYASSGYKDDVELSSTSYQAVSKNYDAPNDDYAKPPVAYDQVKKPEDSYSAEKEAYPSAPSYDDAKKPDDTYGAGSDASSSPSYDAPKKKHYPVIIGRYQVTDSSAFLPKKVGGESGGGSNGGKSVGSQVHGANGEEYVVYYLPYGQPLPIPVRRRRSTDNLEQVQPVFTIRRLKSLADSQRHRRKLRGESLPEEQVLTPEEVHKQITYTKPIETSTVETVTEETVTETLPVIPVVEEEVIVHETDTKKVQDETVSTQDDVAAQDEIISLQVDHQVQDDVSPQADISDDEIVSPQVDEVLDEIISSQIDVSQDEIVPAQVEEILKEDLPVAAEVAVQEEAEKIQEIPFDGEDVSVTTDTPVTIDKMMVAKIEEDLTKSSVFPVSVVDPETPMSDVEEPVGEIIIVKVSAEKEDEPVIVAVEEVSVSQVNMEMEEDAEEPQVTPDVVEEPVVDEIITKSETSVEVEDEPVVAVDGGVANIDIITETEQEDEVNEPPFTSEVAFNTEKEIKNYPAYPSAYDGKKKNPAIFKQSALPGLTQRPVKYLKPPGIATDPKEHYGGYSTWWTKVGSRVAKNYNFE